MSRCAYLLKSRHGVYYFRAVLPQTVRTALALTRRELRVSLRTKDRATAKVLVSRQVFVMQHYFSEQVASRLDFEQRRDRYWRGIELIEAIGEIDPDNEYELDWLYTQHGLSTADCKAYLFALEEKRRRHQGRHLGNNTASQDTADLPSATTTATLQVAAPPASSAASGEALRSSTQQDVPLRLALDRFYAAKIGGNQPTRQATAKKYLDQIRLFVKVVFDGKTAEPMLSDVTEDVLRLFADLLPKLPPRIRLADPRPIAEIVAATTERMAYKTRFSLACAVVMFVHWCKRQGYPSPNGIEGILEDYLKKPKQKEADKKKRAFSPEEMKALLESDEYRNGTFKRPSDYFAPLIAPHAGACEAEILQLTPDDVYQDAQTGIWVMNINEEDGKQTKNENRIRIVPIHKQLIALGWLDYVASIKSTGGTRLFPEDHADDR
jgi:integrase